MAVSTAISNDETRVAARANLGLELNSLQHVKPAPALCVAESAFIRDQGDAYINLNPVLN